MGPEAKQNNKIFYSTDINRVHEDFLLQFPFKLLSSYNNSTIINPFPSHMTSMGKTKFPICQKAVTGCPAQIANVTIHHAC